jgi:hypothetical protein
VLAARVSALIALIAAIAMSVTKPWGLTQVGWHLERSTASKLHADVQDAASVTTSTSRKAGASM